MTSRPQLDALCCVCGRIRTTSTNGAVGDFDSTWRCVVYRRCQTCQRRTRHAYVLEQHDQTRDEAEARDHARVGGLQAQLDEEIERLRSCTVRVCYSREAWESEEVVAQLTQYLDDGVYYLVLNPDAPRAELLAAIERTWKLWTRLDNAGWQVEAASLDDPDSVPYRTMLLARAGRT